MLPKNRIIGCIDASSSAQAVCLYSAWLANTLSAPLTFLHVLEKRTAQTSPDLSGSLGLNSQEELMEELVKLEEAQAKLMMAQGKQLLHVAQDIAKKQGVDAIEVIQKRGTLPDILSQIQEAKIMVLGRQGQQSEIAGHIGSQLESVIRLQKIPVFISVNAFTEPKKIMFAYDGSAEGQKMLENLSISPLLKNKTCHLVMNGTDNAALMDVKARLKNAGIDAQADLITGRPIPESLCQYAKEQHIDLIIMGAYGHSKLREFFIGSNTTAMIATTHVPLLMLR